MTSRYIVRSNLSIILIVYALFAVACGTLQVGVEEPTPTASETTVSSTVTPTATTSGAATASPEPTATRNPSPTGTPSVTSSPMARPRPTETPRPAAPTETSTVPPPTATPATMTVEIFLIAIGDNGVSGPQIGCGDSVVGVERTVPTTSAPLRAALEELFALGTQQDPESGLYNALAQADLTIDRIAIRDGTATIELSGTLLRGGVCDDPRIEAQIEQTASQFATVDEVDVFVNGVPLDEVLSGEGGTPSNN